MRILAICLALGLLISPLGACRGDKIPLPDIAPGLEENLLSWLDEHAMTPEEYVVSKFADHDIVILGEYHRIRHDPLLVQALIPLLYEAGVRNVGIEFARAHDQADIDRLLAMDSYDERLANRIFWNQWPFWGFQEYIDILRAAWELNRSLPEGAPAFRVIGLNARMDWSHVWSPEDRENREVMARVMPDGDSDEVMAATIRREILSRGEKALIYSGINHAYTRFHQPVVDRESGKVVRSLSTRMGNRIYSEIGSRCFMIFLHAPWPPRSGYSDPYVYPADGVIDAVLAKLPPGKRRVGFDVVDSPFGELVDTGSYWSLTDDEFRVDRYCDGWIYQKPIGEYTGVTPVAGWFDEDNRLDAIAQIANPDPRVKNRDRTVESLAASLAADTDFKKRFGHLH